MTPWVLQRAACLSQPEASQASRLLGYQEGCKSVEHSSQSVSQGPPADAGKAKVPRETWMVLEYCDKGSLQVRVNLPNLAFAC